MKFKENKRLSEIVKLSINQQTSAFPFAIFAVLHNSLNLLETDFLQGTGAGCHGRDPERTGQPRAKIKNHL
jgi:hypothetical protein